MPSDILQVQTFLYHGLRSCKFFESVNVVLEREFLASSTVEVTSLWQAPRMITNPDGDAGDIVLTPDVNGKVGVGLLVEMPRLELRNPNSLQRSLVVSVGIIEERNLNMTPSSEGSMGGTMISAEEWAELALDFMYGWLLGLSSALVPTTGTVKSAPDIVPGAEGLICYRAAVELRREHRQTSRCDMPVLSEPTPGNFIFTNGANTPDAAIYYTTAATAGDLGLPGKDNTDAVLWDGVTPVALEIGECINWAAWKDAKLPSHISAQQRTS